MEHALNALRELALLESRDILTKRFKDVHKRTPNVAKCRQIAAHLLQGRQYWDSANQAGDLIRPLLLYYGGLSFCRALTLFARESGGEETLSNSHGMTATGWGQAFATNGVEAVLDFEIVISSGTLTQLGESTGNQEISRCFIGPYPSYVEFIRPCTANGMNGSRITIRDLLKRVPEMSATYERVTGERSATYPVIPFRIDGAHVDLDVLQTEKGPKNWDSLRADLGVPDSIPIGEGRPSHFGNGQPAASMRIPWAETGWLYPQLAIDSDGKSWVISSIGRGKHWNQLTVLFIIAYSIGMLVRYHPTVWLEMTSQSRGDLVMPLLKEARTIVEEQLPKLVVEQFDLLSLFAVTAQTQ